MKQGNRNGTQMVKPKLHQSVPKGKIQPKTKLPPKGGVRIGEYRKDDKWRCKTCKYLNDVEEKECRMCEDPRIGGKKV